MHTLRWHSEAVGVCSRYTGRLPPLNRIWTVHVRYGVRTHGIPRLKVPAGRRTLSRTSVAPSMGTVGVRATVPIENPDEKGPSVAEIAGTFLLQSHWHHGLPAGGAAADVSSITPASRRGRAVAIRITTHRDVVSTPYRPGTARAARGHAKGVWGPGSSCRRAPRRLLR